MLEHINAEKTKGSISTDNYKKIVSALYRVACYFDDLQLFESLIKCFSFNINEKLKEFHYTSDGCSYFNNTIFHFTSELPLIVALRGVNFHEKTKIVIELLRKNVEVNKIREGLPGELLLCKSTEVQFEWIANYSQPIPFFKAHLHSKILNLSRSQIKELPELFVKALKYYNQTSEKPIVTLQLQDNLLENLPFQLAKIVNLKDVRLDGNPLTLIEWIDKKDWNGIKQYLLELENRVSCWNNCKIIIMGDSNQGKSSLCECLRKKKGTASAFIGSKLLNAPNNPSAKPHQLFIYKNIKLDKKLVTKTSIKFTIWDFNNNVIDCDTHKLFFSKSSIYLITIDLHLFSKQNKEGNFELLYNISYWLQNIRLSRGATKTPTFIICTHSDQINSEEEVKKLVDIIKKKYPKEIFYFLQDIIPVSTKTSMNIDSLKQQIISTAEISNFLPTVPKSWIILHDLLIHLKEDNLINLMHENNKRKMSGIGQESLQIPVSTSPGACVSPRNELASAPPTAPQPPSDQNRFFYDRQRESSPVHASTPLESSSPTSANPLTFITQNILNKQQTFGENIGLLTSSASLNLLPPAPPGIPQPVEKLRKKLTRNKIQQYHSSLNNHADQAWIPSMHEPLLNPSNLATPSNSSNVSIYSSSASSLLQSSNGSLSHSQQPSTTININNISLTNSNHAVLPSNGFNPSSHPSLSPTSLVTSGNTAQNMYIPVINLNLLSHIAKYQCNIDDAMSDIIHFLCSSGSLLNYSDFLFKEVSELLILHPQWVCDMIGLLYNHKYIEYPTLSRGACTNKLNKGFIPLFELRKIYKDYPEELHQIILQLLFKFNIIIPVTTEQIYDASQFISYKNKILNSLFLSKKQQFEKHQKFHFQFLEYLFPPKQSKSLRKRRNSANDRDEITKNQGRERSKVKNSTALRTSITSLILEECRLINESSLNQETFQMKPQERKGSVENYSSKEDPNSSEGSKGNIMDEEIFEGMIIPGLLENSMNEYEIEEYWGKYYTSEYVEHGRLYHFQYSPIGFWYKLLSSLLYLPNCKCLLLWKYGIIMEFDLSSYLSICKNPLDPDVKKQIGFIYWKDHQYSDLCIRVRTPRAQFYGNAWLLTFIINAITTTCESLTNNQIKIYILCSHCISDKNSQMLLIEQKERENQKSGSQNPIGTAVKSIHGQLPIFPSSSSPFNQGESNNSSSSQNNASGVAGSIFNDAGIYEFTLDEFTNSYIDGYRHLYCNNIKSPSRKVRLIELAPDLLFASDIPIFHSSQLIISNQIGEGGFSNVYKGYLLFPTTANQSQGESSVDPTSVKPGGVTTQSKRYSMVPGTTPPESDDNLLTNKDRAKPFHAGHDAKDDKKDEGEVEMIPVAIKQLKDEKKYAEFQAEVQIMAQLKHKNILEIYGIQLQPQISMVLEFIEHGDLFGLLHPKGFDKHTQQLSMIDDKLFTWEERLLITLDIALGINELQSHNPPIIHRDLRCSNVFISSRSLDYKIPRAKLADFGLSRMISFGMRGILESWRWLAPELIQNNQCVYSISSDIYSFAICMWEIASKSYPYDELLYDDHFSYPLTASIPSSPNSHSQPALESSQAQSKLLNEEKIKEHIIYHNLRPSLDIIPVDSNPRRSMKDLTGAPPDFIDLIADCWETNPNRRPKINEIIDRLSKMVHISLEKILSTNKLSATLSMSSLPRFSDSKPVPSRHSMVISQEKRNISNSKLKYLSKNMNRNYLNVKHLSDEVSFNKLLKFNKSINFQAEYKHFHRFCFTDSVITQRKSNKLTVDYLWVASTTGDIIILPLNSVPFPFFSLFFLDFLFIFCLKKSCNYPRESWLTQIK